MASVLVFLQPETTTTKVCSTNADSVMLAEAVASRLMPAVCESVCKLSRDNLANTICATNGKIYLNSYFFANQCKNASLTRVTDWNGDSCPYSCTKPVSCQEIGIYLCGSDGNVYFGYCSLYSAQCVDPSIERIECPTDLLI